MLDEKLTTSRLFSDEVQYKVPHYQRRYVWDKTNWRTLWENILAQLGLEIKGDPDDKYDFQLLKQREDTNKKHFTGIIVTRQISSEEPIIFEVIDGQQRLTTFQIILCVIRDILKAEKFTNEANEPQNLIKGTFSSEEYYSLIPTVYDHSAFQVIVDGKYGNLISQCQTLNDEVLKSIKMQLFPAGNPEAVSQNILDVYNHFYKWIWNYKQEMADDGKLGKLLTTIKTGFNFAMLTLGKEDYSEKIFESLNATGKKLSDFDYLRNNLFLRAGEKSKSFYETYWQIFEDSSQQYTFETHYWKTDKQEAFLRAFLIANLGPYCFNSENVNPLDVYRKYSRTAGGIENEFKQLREYAESYQGLKRDMDNPNKPIYLYVQLCSDLSLNCLEPLLLFVKHNNDDDAVDHVCKILGSYLVRRMLCFADKENTFADINDASYNVIEYFLYDAVVEKGKFEMNEFTKTLSTGTEIWPNDEEIKTALGQFKTKDLNFIVYIFRRLKHYRRNGNAAWQFHSFTLEEQTNYFKELQLEENLDVPAIYENLNELCRNFNKLWPHPKSELANFSSELIRF